MIGFVAARYWGIWLQGYSILACRYYFGLCLSEISALDAEDGVASVEVASVEVVVDIVNVLILDFVGLIVELEQISQGGCDDFVHFLIRGFIISTRSKLFGNDRWELISQFSWMFWLSSAWWRFFSLLSWIPCPCCFHSGISNGIPMSSIRVSIELINRKKDVIEVIPVHL